MNKAQRLALFKVIEESAELIVFCAKLALFPDGNHPSTKFQEKSLWDCLQDELADVQAATKYFIRSFPSMSIQDIAWRREEKLKTFEQYAEEGKNS